MIKNMDIIENDINIIKELFDKYKEDLSNIDRQNYSASDLDDFFGDIEYLDNLRVERGCTKMVFMPVDSNYVYKLPFLGDYGLYKEDSEYENENYVSYSDIDPDFHQDFCDIETDRCNNMCKDGYGEYIAKEEYLCDIDGFAIYIQERGKTFSDMWLDRDAKTREEKEIVEEILYDFWGDDFNLPDRWIYDFATRYGIDEAIDFLNYLLDNGYNNDLHDDNIGYIGGCPVLIDYSGYIYQWGWTDF